MRAILARFRDKRFRKVAYYVQAAVWIAAIPVGHYLRFESSVPVVYALSCVALALGALSAAESLVDKR